MDEDNKLHSGNLFFEHKYPSINIETAIKRMDSFEQFESYYTEDLMDENLLLGRYLGHLLEIHNFNPSRASKNISKDEGYVGKIVRGEELNPTRDVLLAICVLIGATVEETQILLRYAGKQPLYARRKRDAIIWFALRKRPSFSEVDSKKRYYDACRKYLSDLDEYLDEYFKKSKPTSKSARLTRIITKGDKK